MDIKAITCGLIGTNSYMIIEGGKAILIDPAEYAPLHMIRSMEGVEIVAILLTHGHFDHITAVAEYQSEGIPVYVHELDAPKCRGTEMIDRARRYSIKTFEPDVLLKGGETLELIGLKIKVLFTPGHSKGGVCYMIDNNIFCGDTLFYGGYGRYDFYDGDFAALKASIMRIFALEGDYNLYCGHGENTTLAQERERNMILWS